MGYSPYARGRGRFVFCPFCLSTVTKVIIGVAVADIDRKKPKNDMLPIVKLARIDHIRWQALGNFLAICHRDHSNLAVLYQLPSNYIIVIMHHIVFSE